MSRKRIAFASLVVFLGAIAVAQEMPQPGPEHEAMGYFEGKWRFEGESKDGPMGPGGKMSFTETCEWFDSKFALVCRSEGNSPMGPTKSLSIMSYDREAEEYHYYAVETGMPPFLATGTRDGKAWNWETESKMGDQTFLTHVTVTETTPTSYTFEMEVSTDGGSTWQTLMEGTTQKITS